MTSTFHGNIEQESDDCETVTQVLLLPQHSTSDQKMTASGKIDPPDQSLNNGVRLKVFAKLNPDQDVAKVEISNECSIVVDDEIFVRGPCVKCMESIEGVFTRAYSHVEPYADRASKVFMLLLYTAYFTYCMYYRFGDEGSIILLVGTAIFVIILCRKLFLTPAVTAGCSKAVASSLSSPAGRKTCTVIRYGLYIAVTAGLGFFLGFDVLKENPHNSQSLIGIAVIIVFCLVFSKRPSRVNWHPVFWGFVTQFVFAIITLRTEFGYSAFKWVGDVVQRLVQFSDDGSEFVIGKDFKQMGLAFSVVGVIVFFNCLIYLLTYWGVMEVIVIKVGTFLGICLQTGPIESVNAVANIFMGYAEVALLLRPYLPSLSKSELCAVMTGGFASVSGGVLGIFILFGAPANHLLTAAVISAPAALSLTKIIYPETERVDVRQQTNLKLRDPNDKSSNALSVCADGALMATKVAVPIMATMLAFVSLLSMINSMLDWFGQRAGVDGLSFNMICSYLLYPLSYAMGAVPADCGMVGALIGTKLIATPMVGYAELGKIIKNRHILEAYIRNNNGTWHWSGSDIILDALNTTLVNGVIDERSEVITTYAMCGFSAFASIGICIGSLTALCPSRKSDIIEIVLTAFFAGNMASFATGAVAGIMFTKHTSGVAG